MDVIETEIQSWMLSSSGEVPEMPTLAKWLGWLLAERDAALAQVAVLRDELRNVLACNSLGRVRFVANAALTDLCPAADDLLRRAREGERALAAGIGIGRLITERLRQINEEHRSLEWDQQYTAGELGDAAACYAMTEEMRAFNPSSRTHWSIQGCVWPWDNEWWKPAPDNRSRELEKAGALIAAEIDRLAGKLTAKPPCTHVSRRSRGTECTDCGEVFTLPQEREMEARG